MLGVPEAPKPDAPYRHHATVAKQKRFINEMLAQLHERWTPHDGQKPILRALFYDEIKDIFVQAGRSFGKTELVAYALWRYAMMHPRSENYYFAPYMKQAREILWASSRIQTFGPPAWMATNPNSTEMRITLRNGAFIKLDGSDNIDSYRGVKPRGLIVYDEFKDFRPGFYDAFDPNRAAHECPLIIVGTPPQVECQFTELAERWKADASKRFFHAPTKENPFIGEKWLADKKGELSARGEDDVWEREYEARFVRGGRATIFPMFDSKHHIRDAESIASDLHQKRWDLDWVLSIDPATVSTFGGLVCAVNPYTREFHVLSELYESTQSNTSVTQIMPRLQTMKAEAFPHEPDQVSRWEERWIQVCDEAEAWFINEALDRFDEGFARTSKAVNDKEVGISLIRDLMIHRKLIISSSCVNLIRELQNYIRADNGKIPKKNDHLIDCLRYALHAMHYSLNESIPFEATLSEDPRVRRMEVERNEEGMQEDSIDIGLIENYF